jgi:Domain of unknown function
MMRMNKINYHILFEQAGVVATLSAYAIFSPQRHDKLKNWTDKTKKWIDRVSKNLIVVSVLITTIAFSAAFNMPGSYNGNGAANLRQKKSNTTPSSYSILSPCRHLHQQQCCL